MRHLNEIPFVASSRRPSSTRSRALLRHASAILLFGLTLSVRCLAAQTSSATSGQLEIATGLQQLRSGHASEAKTSFDAAVRAAPRSADALTWRGISENQLGLYAAAAADFRAALRLDRNTLPAHYNLALSLIRLHETDAAIEQLKFVIGVQPNALQPRFNLALLLEEKNQRQEAATQLQAAHAIEPDDSGVVLHLLDDILKLRQMQDVPKLVQALQGTSIGPGLKQHAGTSLLEAGEFKEAVMLLKAAHQQEPAQVEIAMLLARAYIGAGRYEDAVVLLEPAVASGTAGATYLSALAYSGTGNRQKAVDAFQHAAALDPHDARPLYHLGLLAASSPDARSQATDLLRSAIKLDPHNETYALALARILLEQDQAAEALRVIAQTKISSAESLTLEGIATISLRGVASAQPILQRAVVQNPDFALAQDLLGFCLYKQGNYAKAAEAYKVAADQEPSRLVYLHNTALAYYRANQIPQALNYAQRASSIPDTTADDHALLGKVYVAAGRQQEALPELQRAVELNPELESAYYTLARTYMRMGDRQQATNWSEKLSALKQRHAASSATAVESDASSVRSSTLLSGNVISVDEESFP